MAKLLRCPEPSALATYVRGTIAEDETDPVGQHAAACPKCGAAVRSMRSGETAPGTATRAGSRSPTGPTQSWSAASETDAPTDGRRGQFPFLKPATQPDELGRLGTYRVLGLLGGGGMGIVFRAEDPDLARIVALKVVKPHLIGSADIRDRFLAEARALAALEHDHIVTVYQVGYDDGVPFLAMALLRGETLEQRLEPANGPLPVDDILRIGAEVATGLAVAHARGLIHRDIKPANLWLEDLGPGSPPRVKILDFGLAQALTAEASGRVAGTPAYMAPEQAVGQPVDGRSDLFSLGCVLYRMATGRPAFTGTDLAGILLAVALDEPTPIAELNPRVPAPLVALIGRLLAKAQADRPPTAEAVADELRAMAQQRRRSPTRRALLIVGGLTVLAGAVGTPFFAARPRTVAVAELELGEITIACDEPSAKFVLTRDGVDHPVEPGKPIRLPAGVYTLRVKPPIGERNPWPKELTLTSGDRTTPTISLIGPGLLHKEHESARGNGGIVAIDRADGPHIFSVLGDRTLVAWDLNADVKKSLKHNISPLRCLTLSPDRKTIATGSGDAAAGPLQVVRFWNIDTHELSDFRLDCASQLNALAYSPDGNLLATGDNSGNLRLWDLAAKKNEPLRSVKLTGFVRAVAFRADGKSLFAADSTGVIHEWSVTNFTPLPPLNGHRKEVRGFVLLPDGKRAVSVGEDKVVNVWDLTTRLARSWTAPAVLQAVAVSSDGKRLLTGDLTGNISLWDTATGANILSFTGHNGGATTVAFLPDGKRAVSGGRDGWIRTWYLPK